MPINIIDKFINGQNQIHFLEREINQLNILKYKNMSKNYFFNMF